MSNEDDLIALAHDLRGRVLESAIQMETMIDVYISEHFIEDLDRQSEFAFTVLSFVNMRDKIQILNVLLEKDPNNKPEDIQILVVNLNKLNSERNTFAHWSADITAEGLEDFKNNKGIAFVKRRPGKFKGKTALALRHLYSEDAANRTIRRFNDVNAVLRKLLKM